MLWIREQWLIEWLISILAMLGIVEARWHTIRNNKSMRKSKVIRNNCNFLCNDCDEHSFCESFCNSFQCDFRCVLSYLCGSTRMLQNSILLQVVVVSLKWRLSIFPKIKSTKSSLWKWKQKVKTNYCHIKVDTIMTHQDLNPNLEVKLSTSLVKFINTLMCKVRVFFIVRLLS